MNATEMHTGILAPDRELVPRSAAPRDLVYKVPGWHRYLWREYREGNEEVKKVEDEGKAKAPRFPDYARELFTRMYQEEPQRLEDPPPEAQWAERMHQLAEQLPEFKRLADRCRHDQLWSGMAATALAEGSLAAMPEPPEPLQDPERLRRQMRGMEDLEKQGAIPCEQAQAARQQIQQALQAQEQALQQYAQGLDESAVRQAARRAVEQAQQGIDDAEQALGAFGVGSDPGSPGQGGDVQQKMELARKLGQNRKLQRIAQEAGRMRRIAAQKQRTKASHARDEVVGVTSGGDLARMLGSEAVKLARPKLKLLLFRQLLERSVLEYELKGKEREGRGPVIVLIDNSGSMSGEKEVWSKAVAIGLLEVAAKQGRSWGLVHFDTRVQWHHVYPKGKVSTDELIAAMAFFSGGGTQFEPPLQKALEWINQEKELKKADVIIITDGIASPSNEFVRRYRQVMQDQGATTYAVLVEQYGGYGSEVLATIADRVLTLADLRDDGKAHDALFTI